MYAHRCPNRGAFLDPCERCDCAKEPKPAPVTAKRAAVTAEERVQRKTGIVMPDRPMGDSSNRIDADAAETTALSY